MPTVLIAILAAIVLLALVTSIRSRVDYRRTYFARVLDQADGLLDVEPEARALPRRMRVPFSTGVPGISATLRPGARVVVGFRGCDPSLPYACAFDASAITSIHVDAELVQVRSRVNVTTRGAA